MYGTRYILQFNSEKYNHDYKILVKEKDYAGQSENKALGAAPVLRRDDSDSGISGTSLELVIQADVDGELTSLYTVDNKKFLVELYRNGVLVWCGYVLPEKYSEPYIAVPYDVSVTASDGLGILKDIPFALTGERTLFDVIKYCCDQTELSLDFVIFSSLTESSMKKDNSVFPQATFDSSAFSGKTCYEVLGILMTSLDAFVTECDGKWYVVRYTDLNKDGYWYSNSGKLQGRYSLASLVLGSVDSSLYPIGNMEFEVEPAYKSVKFISEYETKPSFLQNYDFSGGEKAWSGFEFITREYKGTYFAAMHNTSGSQERYIQQGIDVEKSSESVVVEVKFALAQMLASMNGHAGEDRKFALKVHLSGNGQNYYLTEDGWGTGDRRLEVHGGLQDMFYDKKIGNYVDNFGGDFKIIADGFPVSGRLTITIYNIYIETSGSTTVRASLFLDYVIVTNDCSKGIDVSVSLAEKASTSYEDIDIRLTDVPFIENADKMFYNGLKIAGKFTSAWSCGGKTDSFLYTVLKCTCSRIGFARKQLSGTIQGSMLSPFVLVVDKYSGELFYPVECSLNLLDNEMNCTLKQFMPYVELSGDTTESPRVTNNSASEYRSSGDNEVRVYQSGSGVPMRIKDLSPTELQPDSVIEVDRNNAPKSGKATLQKLLEFVLTTGDVWTKEELQVVEGYILYLGEKIKAGDSDLWAGHHFSDYLNQALLTTSNVEFASVLTKILTTNEITTPDFVSGLLGSGARLKDGHLELNEITVRQRLNVFLLVIQKAMYQGGMLILSPGGAEITSVVDGGSYYKCTYDTKNGKLKQPFVEDDQLLCQSFDEGNTKRYWRKVTSVGEDYFNLSKTDCEVNSGIPAVGDEVVVLGNRTNATRQSAMILCSVGADTPYMDTYDEINTFSLEGKLRTREGNLSGIVDEVFGQLDGTGLYAKNVYLRGKFALSTGTTVEDKFGQTDSKLSNVEGQLNTQQGVISDLKTEMSAIPGKIEQSVSVVIDWATGEIDSKIAKTVTVTAPSQIFKYASGYTGTPSPSSILLSAMAKNFSPTSYQWQYLNDSTWTNISGATSSTYSVAPGNTILFPSGVYTRTFRCICNGDEKLSDNFTLAKLADGATGQPGVAGVDAYTVLLTNEAHTIACDSSGNPLPGELANATTKVVAYKGSTEVSFVLQNLVAVGGTFAIDGADGVKCTALTSDSGGCTFEVKIGSVVVKKVFGVTKATAGTDGRPGAAGKGVLSIVEEYYLSTSATTQTGGSWVMTPPAWVNGRYFWTRSIITYTDDTTSTTTPVCVTGATGSTGGTGNGISAVDVLYYLSTSATSLSGGSWVTTSPAWVNGKYIWSKTKITYTNGTTKESAAACITGSTGATGAAGKGISSTSVTYQASASGTTVPTGTWSATIPSVAANQYLWTRTIITYTDNTTSTSYSISKIGAPGTPGGKGDKGDTGNGIKSSAVTYQASTSGITIPTGTWSASIPPVSANQYLWTRTILTYTDNTSSTSYSIGKMGANGTDGKGVKSVIPQYYLSTSSTTQSGGSWSNTIPAWTNGKYIWTRLVTTYTDNSTTTTSPVYDIANKAVEVAYSKVEAGINNLASGITIFAKQTDFNSLGTRVTKAEASITTQASNIELKVSKNGVVAAINASPESVKISAGKIDLVGKVTFSMFDTDAKNTINGKVTSAQATTIATTQVNTLKNSLGSLAYSNKVEQSQLGTTIITGGHIKTDLIDVDSIFAKDIVFSGSLTSSDYKATVSGSGASASVTTVGSRYSKSGFVVSSGGGTGILPSSSGVTQVAKIEAIGNQALIVGLEIVAKDTYSSAYLHEQTALVLEARTAYSNPSTRPRSIYSKAGDIVVENGDIITNGFIYAGQGIRAVPRITTITPSANTRKILNRQQIDNTDVIYYYNTNNNTSIKLPDADEGKRIAIVNTGTKSGGISDTLSRSANFTLNTWEVLDLVFILGFHNALGRGWMIVSDYSN